MSDMFKIKDKKPSFEEANSLQVVKHPKDRYPHRLNMFVKDLRMVGKQC